MHHQVDVVEVHDFLRHIVGGANQHLVHVLQQTDPCELALELKIETTIYELENNALLHYFQGLYSNLSSPLITTTSISEFDACTSKKFQTAVINLFTFLG